MTDPRTSGPTATGLSSNVSGALSYLFGIITGVIFFVLEKENRFVRFHAMQSILLSLVYIVLRVVLGLFAYFPLIGWVVAGIGFTILGLVALLLWLVLMFRAFSGSEWELPIIGPYARRIADGDVRI